MYLFAALCFGFALCLPLFNPPSYESLVPVEGLVTFAETQKTRGRQGFTYRRIYLGNNSGFNDIRLKPNRRLGIPNVVAGDFIKTRVANSGAVNARWVWELGVQNGKMRGLADLGKIIWAIGFASLFAGFYKQNKIRNSS